MIATLHGYEWELNEYARNMTRIQMRIRFLYQGFLTNDQFLDDWISLSANGRIGTTLNFRERFCKANHYQVQLPSKKWGRVVEVWGYAVPYVVESGKPKLIRMLPRNWLLKQIGRSVRPPAFCAPKL